MDFMPEYSWEGMGIKQSITDSQSVWDTRLAVARQDTAPYVRSHIVTLCDGSPPYLGLHVGGTRPVRFTQFPGKTLSRFYMESNPLFFSMWWGPCSGRTYYMQRPFDLGFGLQ